jgi:hypothetical protein
MVVVVVDVEVDVVVPAAAVVKVYAVGYAPHVFIPKGSIALTLQ